MYLLRVTPNNQNPFYANIRTLIEKHFRGYFKIFDNSVRDEDMISRFH